MRSGKSSERNALVTVAKEDDSFIKFISKIMKSFCWYIQHDSLMISADFEPQELAPTNLRLPDSRATSDTQHIASELDTAVGSLIIRPPQTTTACQVCGSTVYVMIFYVM